MKVLTVIIIFGFFFTANGQKTITYETLREELINSPESAIITIYSKQLEEKSQFYIIELVTDHTLYEPPIFNNETKKQLSTDILTTGIERKLIIDYLNNNKHLENLYVRIDQHFSNIKNHKDSFLLNEPLVIIEIFHQYENESIQTYLKLDNIEEIENTLKAIGEILNRKERKYFKELIMNIKKLNN